MTAYDWFALGVIVICILLSAFFAGSETALTASSRASMHRLDKQGNQRAALVNHLLNARERMIGALLFGNEVLHPGQPDRLNNVEVVSVPQPLAGTYLVSVSANFLSLGPRQSYALVVTGDIDDGSARFRAVRH